MLKVRIMPTLLYKEVGLVKGIGFDSWRRIGSAMQALKVYNLREVDELVFLDITATRDGRAPDFGLIDELADECFMPLAVGGGVKSVEDIRGLLTVGADKVVINSAALAEPA
jgi:cyclase